MNVNNNTQKAAYICPHCKNPIYDDDALLCLYCGGKLNRSKGFMSRLRLISLAGIIIALVCFIALILL